MNANERKWIVVMALALSGSRSAGAAEPAEAPEAPRVPAASAVGQSYPVPYRLTPTKHLLVRAKLNGKGPFSFIIDTGAPTLYVSTEAAKKAGISAGEDGWAGIDRLEIEGGAVLEKTRARVEEPFQLKGMNALGLAGVRMDGVFGYTLLARFRIQIDLTQSAMTWTRVDYEPQLPTRIEDPEGQPVAPPPGVSGLENLAKMASALLPHRGEDEVVKRGFLGMELVNEPGTPRVRAVLAGGPAARAGMTAGDRIAKMTLPGKQTVPVRSAPEILRLAANVMPGQVVRFTVQRGKKMAQLSLTAAAAAL